MLQRGTGRNGLRTRNSAIASGFALLLGAFVFSPGHPALAGPNSAATETGQGKMINIFVTVRDKKGRIVSDLTSNDFILAEDGRPQNLQYLAKAASQPLILGLLVDTSPSQNRELDRERSASGDFFDQMVREDMDKAFVIHFDHEVELLQDLTASHQKLEQALATLQTSQVSQSQGNNSQDTDSGQGPGGRGSGMRFHRGGAQLYDAVYLASNELMKKQNGRKAVILLSDGVDRGSKETLDSSLEAAQRANTIIYSVLVKGEQEYQGGGGRGGFGYPGMGGPGMGRRGGGGRGYPQENRPDPKKILGQLSSETGGRLFEASKKMPLTDIYGQIEEDLKNQYNLGYTPSRAEGMETGFHHIQLTTTNKDDAVAVRSGYYSGDFR